MLNAAPGFDAAALRAELPLHGDGAGVNLTPAQQAYLDHYGIHFAADLAGVSHEFGVVEAPGHRIATHLWVPPEAVGSAVVVHGYYDHTGLYGHLIRGLLERGLAVLAFDLPGHGLSTGAPATIDSFDRYVEALDAALTALGPRLPGPWSLFGQSTGGAVSMEWLLARRAAGTANPFARVVLLAPLVRPYGWPLQRLVYNAARLFITERPRTFAQNAENPEFLTFLREHDPLQARVLPVAWVTAMVQWRRRFERYPASNQRVLVVQGHADQTVDWRYNLRVIDRLFDARVFAIPAARHHLVNESPAIRAQILQAIEGELAGVVALRPVR
jgi:alpha-beta hydrolase superfamily lysophospholipase